VIYVVSGKEGNDMLLITTDRGYAEIYQYVKIGSSAILLFLIGQKNKKQIYLVLSFIFIYLLFDDALRIHEIVGGEIIGGFLQSMFSSKKDGGYHLGQIVYAVPVLIILLSVILKFFPKKNQPDYRNIKILLVLLCLLAVFAVGMDSLQSSFEFKGSRILEDAGEMLIVSIITWFIYNLKKKGASSKIL
jgi:hypothetical protein